jgi:hypothetical protein
MTPAERIEKAFDDANLGDSRVSPARRPGRGRVAQAAFSVIDNGDVHEAFLKLLQAEKPERMFAPY